MIAAEDGRLVQWLEAESLILSMVYYYFVLYFKQAFAAAPFTALLGYISTVSFRILYSLI